MSRHTLFALVLLWTPLPLWAQTAQPVRSTVVEIEGEKFLINGSPTYEGRKWEGNRIEGLLFNSRMVQAIFDDRNPETRSRWNYPDTGKWDPQRNVSEFIAEMPGWRRAGLLGVTINLQGGSPEGYSKTQPWHNSALNDDGSLEPVFMDRLTRVLDRADELGMAVILGIYYFGQDQRLTDEQAVIAGVDATVDWLVDRKYRNVLLEINNECNVRAYDHEILKPDRVHELIRRARERSIEKGHRLLVSTSYGGGTVPRPNVVRESDFLLLHGNGVRDPKRIGEMVRETREVDGYRPMPILFNEDDHFDFDQPQNNFRSAIEAYASWGYFDYRMKDEGFDEGYQSVPVNWSTSSERKRGFFKMVAEVTGQAEATGLKDATEADGAKNRATAEFPRFVERVIDADIGKVCYAVTLADVDGDGKKDIVAVTENRVLWYQNPSWSKRIIIADQTPLDNVCIEAGDITGDGQIDFALGAGWTKGGTVYWLTRSASLDQPWNVHFIADERWVHRMRFADVLGKGKPQLVVSPLNASQGDGVRLLAFEIPEDPVKDRWPMTVMDDGLNRMHNHWHLPKGDSGDPSMQPMETLTASREGIHRVWRDGENWSRTKLGAGAIGDSPDLSGAGEIKSGRLRGGNPFLVTVEPMHGTMLVIYLPPDRDGEEWQRHVIDDGFQRGHAVWTADLDGDGGDEIVFGHSDTPGTFGVIAYRAVDASGTRWERQVIDSGGMATEDLVVGDLTGDGRPDIVAGGRATHNLTLYVNMGN